MKLNNLLHVYIKSMGKIFPVEHIAKDDDEANEFCRRHKDCGVIAHDEKNGLVFIANLYSLTVPSSVLPEPR